ncbi:MAG: hypothetical protein QM727_03160 [Niabella sp.]
MKKIFSTLIILLGAMMSKGQIFYEKSFYPDLNTIKAKYFNGSGGKGYWSLERTDSLGRIIEKSNYKKKKPLRRTLYRYNYNNDIIYEIAIDAISKVDKVDTTKYEYSYINNKISFQKCIFSDKDSIVYRLVKNVGDSTLTYQRRSYHYLPNKKINNRVDETFILTYQNDLLTKKEFIDNDNNQEITNLEYYQNGKLRRRTIRRVPEADYKIVYTGGPGSDNQFHEYRYDRRGRIKTKYTVVDNKVYKLATYSYRTK